MTDGTEHPGGAAAPGQDTEYTRPTPPGPGAPEQAAPRQGGVSGAAEPGSAAPGQAAGQSPVVPGQAVPQTPAAPGSYGYPQPVPTPGSYGYPQPAPAPGSYGYPQPAPAPGSYGYPQPGNPYQAQPAAAESAFPGAGFQQPPAGQQPHPPFSPQGQQPFPGQPPQGQQPFGQAPFGPSGDAPDWAALAERNDTDARRRRRMWTAGIVVAACLLGVGAGTLVIENVGGEPDPVATGSADPSASAAASGGAQASGKPGNEPTVPGQANVLADRSGQSNLAIGPDAQVNKVQNGYVVRFRSNSNSFAQSANRMIDVTKGFSVSAWVYNEAAEGSRSAISQGDGVSASFDLGRDDTNGHKSWVFRVQTADGGADGTVVQVTSDTVGTVAAWVLLSGTYDPATQSIALYVNGAPAGTAKVPGVWAGPGPLELGRTRKHNIWSNYWAGVLGNVKVWDKALTPAQVANVKDGGSGLTAKPIGSWLVG